MFMKEIVWVIGHSGVGKETFCRWIIANPDSELARELGWSGSRIGICESSISLVPRGHQKEKHDERHRIIDELKEKQEELDVILLKWQALDTYKGRVLAIKQAFPESITRAVLLETGNHTIEQRHTNRESNWTPSEGWQAYLAHETPVIRQALSDFGMVTHIDTTTGYKVTRHTT